MVRIRLRRTGKKKQPSYRVVVADSEFPRDGRFIENIGFYNPRSDPPTIEIETDRALYWLGQGAQPSDPVARLLHKQGILAQFEALKQGEPLVETSAAEVVAEAEVEAEPEPVAEAETEDAAEAEAEPEGEPEAEA